MGNKFASGKFAIAECDRCSFQYPLKQLRKLVIKGEIVDIKVCPECWEPDQPQLMLGEYPVEDPQALREPRPDISYVTSGVDVNGDVSGGSRIIQWGWYPVGGASSFDTALTPNNLVLGITLGTVTVATV